MSEANLWKWLKSRTKHWDIDRIENVLASGTPDVNYCAPNGKEGWVELKYAPRFPPSGKPTFSLTSQHNLTPQQEDFLLRRSKKNSNSGILAQIGKERFFISACHAEHFNEMTEAEFRAYNELDVWLTQ